MHNGAELLDAEHSQVRDGERATRAVLSPQFSILGLEQEVLMWCG